MWKEYPTYSKLKPYKNAETRVSMLFNNIQHLTKTVEIFYIK
ncbi:MAG: hypothetical protein A4E25_01763 [Methanobacterium sp. PtaB.Bin024]|jgi:hypothetical protein|nr:MAG: hypothetical protein A4E25_01763 [Methanobacterium sp. PtaB.Bin024]